MNNRAFAYCLISLALALAVLSTGGAPSSAAQSQPPASVASAHDSARLQERTTSPDFSCASVTEIPQIECEALVALYNSANGGSWVDNDGWLHTDTPCSWHGVWCTGGHVAGLELGGNRLSGTIPPELGDLSNLEGLWLEVNQLSGPIPPQLGNLSSMWILSLHVNQLSGSIPPQLGNMTNLQILSLSGNQLSGTIPSQLGRLENLTTLILAGNPLSGSIPPELGNLRSLRELTLSNTQLSGNIPPELGNLGSLRWLSLLECQLSGSIPPELGDLGSLEELHLASNQLSGTIPPELGNLGSLRWLSLYENQLSGSIPPELGDLGSLTTLQLDSNQLSGTIPPQLGNLGSLEDLWLHSNQLSGSIPPELGNLRSLGRLDLSRNQLSGNIPPELGDLGNLAILLLRNNQLGGTIPPQLGNLGDLEGLWLNDNQLIGDVPPELGNLGNLWHLDLCDNKLSGALPLDLTNLTSLWYFCFARTELCEPDAPEFQDWLAGISHLSSTGIICAGATATPTPTFTPTPTSTPTPKPTYSVSGRVSDVNGSSVAGVTISDSAGHTAITDDDGNYTLEGMEAGTYTFTPSRGAGWTFVPSWRIVTVPPHTTGQDFQGFDRPPIVFVHGWQGWPPWGSCEPSNPDSLFEGADDDLRAAGYHVDYAYLVSSPCYTPRLAENVTPLRIAIASAKAATGKDKVILIAHSMGGLVSRAYLEDQSTYPDDVEALFTFGSPHQGVPADVLVFLLNGATLGKVCKDYQPAVCDFSTLGMILFNHDHPTRAAGVTYHAISGDAPFLSRSELGMLTDAFLPGPDDGLVQTSSGTGLQGILDPFVTDEVHSSRFGTRSYFIRDGGQSRSYEECLEPVLVSKESATCVRSGTPQAVVADTPELTARTPFEYGTLLAGQTVTRTLWFEGGPTLLASRWQTGTVAFTLVDPSAQVIDPAYVATHPEVATYEAEATAAMYYFPNASAGRWRLVLEGEDDIPPGGSNYVTFAAFESAVRISGGTDHNWYIPGATAVITASLSGSPASAVVTATILYADGTGETVSLLPQGGGEYQATFTVPNVPGYVEVRLVATGTTAGQIPFERGTSLVFQISSGSVALSGVYSDAPQPRSAGSSLYQALLVTAGVEVTLGGEVGLSADLVDAEGQFVAHALTIEEVAAGSGSLTLRFDGDDIYASQRSGPYTLTNLLLTDHRGVPLVLAEAEDVYTTAAYDYRSFDRERICLPLVLGGR